MVKERGELVQKIETLEQKEKTRKNRRRNNIVLKGININSDNIKELVEAEIRKIDILQKIKKCL